MAKATKSASLNPLQVGAAVLIRTVTNYHVGKVAEIDDKFVVLSDAAWVADTGRFADALKTGILKEVEPFAGPVAVSLGSIVDVTLWTGSLPLEQK